MEMLCLRNITYEDKNRCIIENVNMTFREGIIYSILGPNGAGKSTLAHIIMGVKKPTEGRVILDGEDITNLGVSERAKHGISLLWQGPARYEGITVEEYLTLGGALKVERRELKEVLRLVGLPYELYAGRFVDKSLSGGERKRVELASIMLLKPKYAILDEPDSGAGYNIGGAH
ncbi:ATP-binding cassette domain-containing protein [Thermococcus sp.]|uniref:ATP-binding cassette domain-containing protein n=1 Tax=Thermococcus sp. TaxID=35749 RepID=UPI00342EFE25